jgi:hypothetical protein
VNLVANSRLGIVKYNPRNIRRESGATRSLRTLWVPEEDTRILLTVVVSKAYGLSLGCLRAPIELRIGSWIQTSHRRHGVEPNGSVPLWQRRGVACLAPRSCGTRGP